MDLQTGLEIEFLLVNTDAERFTVVDDASLIQELETLDRVTHEFGVYQCEIDGPPTATFPRHEDVLVETFRAVEDTLPANVSSVLIAAFPYQFTPEIYPDTRLQELATTANDKYGHEPGNGVEWQTGLQSLQINMSPVSAASSPAPYFNEGLHPIFEALVQLIPYSVVLTANSAFFNGDRVNSSNGSKPYVNARRPVWQQSANSDSDRYGIPPHLPSFDAYTTLLKEKTGVLYRETSRYWDVRFRTRDKTGETLPLEEWRVEYRPMDLAPTITENLGHAAFVLAGVRAQLEDGLVLDRTREQLQALTEKVCIHGLDAETENGEAFREDVETVNDVVEEWMTAEEKQYWEETNPLVHGVRSREQVEQGTDVYVEQIFDAFHAEIH